MQAIKLAQSVERYIDAVLPVRSSGRRSHHVLQRQDNTSTRSQPISQPSYLSSTSTSRSSMPSTASSAWESLHQRTPLSAMPTSPPSTLSPASSAVVQSTHPSREFLNYCPRCGGTCINTSAHGTTISNPSTPSEVVTNPLPPDTFIQESFYDTRHRASYPQQTSSVPPTSLPIYVPPLRTLARLRGTTLPALTSNAPSTTNVLLEPPSGNAITATPSVQSLPSTGSPSIHSSPRDITVLQHDDIDNEHSPEQIVTVDTEDSEEELASEDDEPDANDTNQPSPFHPIAGFIGTRPRGWDTRHERSESPQDFW